MAFIPTNKPIQYVPRPIPKLDQSKALHLERELRSIERSLTSVIRALQEVQDYLEAQP